MTCGGASDSVVSRCCVWQVVNILRPNFLKFIIVKKTVVPFQQMQQSPTDQRQVSPDSQRIASVLRRLTLGAFRVRHGDGLLESLDQRGRVIMKESIQDCVM